MKKTEIRRGDIFSYDFGTRIGSIQSCVRPVLVIQADNFNANAPTVIVASITSVIKKRYLPSHIILGEDFGLTKPSMVLLEQIQTVNKDDLTEYIGFVDDERLWRQINAALKKTFGGTHYIKKVSYRTLIFQVLCCFLLFLLHFCHMALEACFHIFGVKRFDDTNTVVINVDNLIPLAVKIAGG